MKRVLLGTVALLCLASCSYRVYPVDALVDNYKLAMTTPEEVAAKENVAVFLSEQEIPGPYKLIAFLENPAPASKDILKKAVMKADELGGNAVIIQSARSFKVIELTGRPVRKASVARTQPSPRPEPRVAPTPKQKEPRAKEGNVIDKVKGAPIFQKDEAKAEARAEARAAKAEAAKTRAIEAEAAKAKAAAERASKAEAEKAAKAEAEAAKAKAAAERAAKAEAEKAAKAEAEAAKAKAAAEKAAKAEAEKAAKAEAEAAKAKAAADQQFAREQAARAKAEAEAEAARVRAEAEAAKAKAAAEKAAAEKAAAEKAATAAAAKTGTTRKSPVFDDNTLQWFTSGYVYRVKEEEQAEIIDAMNYEIRENLKICQTQAEAEFIAGKIDQLEKFNNSQPIPSTALTSKIKGYKSLLKKLSSKFSGEQSAAAGAVQSVKDFFQNLGNK